MIDEVSRLPTPLIQGEHLCVSGEDCVDYLQNIVSNDIMELRKGHIQYAVFLTPQAKVICDLFIIRLQEKEFLLIIASQFIASILMQLRLYARRRAVLIERDTRFIVYHSEQDKINNARYEMYQFHDPRIQNFWCYSLCKKSDVERISLYDYDYYKKRILLGLIETGVEYPTRQCFLHEANIDCLNGVSFNKGCYIGQEVVSHMQHKAKTRKRQLLFWHKEKYEFECDAPVYHEGKRVGKIVHNITTPLCQENLSNANVEDETVFLQEMDYRLYVFALIRFDINVEISELSYQCHGISLNLHNTHWF